VSVKAERVEIGNVGCFIDRHNYLYVPVTIGGSEYYTDRSGAIYTMIHHNNGDEEFSWVADSALDVLTGN
jgi:hypothetical protein